MNFESTFGTLPPKGLDLAMADPNPDAQAALPLVAASYLTQILGYMDQMVIYNQINLSQGRLQHGPISRRPRVRGAMHSGTNSVYSVAINVFLCPSSPGPATINYYNAYWGPYGDGGGAVCTPGAPSPGGKRSEPQIRHPRKSGAEPNTSRSPDCITRPFRRAE